MPVLHITLMRTVVHADFDVFKRRLYSAYIFFFEESLYSTHTLACVFEANMTFKQQFW